MVPKCLFNETFWHQAPSYPYGFLRTSFLKLSLVGPNDSKISMSTTHVNSLFMHTSMITMVLMGKNQSVYTNNCLNSSCQFTLITKILIANCPIARILIAKSTIAQILIAKSNNCPNTDCPNTDCPNTDCLNTVQPREGLRLC